MNFEKYTVILGFIFGVISAAYFISGKGKDHDKNKLSGLGAFVAVTLLAIGFILMWRDDYLCSGSYSVESSDFDVYSTSSGAPSSSASSSDTDDEKEKILDRAMRLSYIEVYPDEVNYTLSEIDIYVKSDGNILNMRSGPNDSYAQVGQVKNGKEVVKLSASKNDYTYIFDPASEKYGWVLSKYVR